MVDESFHLTSNDVRRYDFGSALRGYDKARVDQFRDQVAEELERLARAAVELEAKAKGFHEQLRAFREREKAMNEALVSAQQLSGTIRDQADREGQLVVREARADADRIVDDARSEVKRLHSEIESLERMRRAHVAQIRAILQRQMMDIEASDNASEIALTVKVAAAAAATPPSAVPAVPSPAAGASASTANAAGQAATVVNAPAAATAKPAGAAPTVPSAQAVRMKGAVGHPVRSPAPAVPSAPAAPAPAPAPSVSPAAAAPKVEKKEETDGDDAKGGPERRPSRSHTPLWLDASIPE